MDELLTKGLVFINDVKHEPYTTDEIIARYSGNTLDSIRRLIRNHRKDFQELGFLGFEIRKLPGRGRPAKIYQLNERQATLLMTYLDNTPQVRRFKKALVKTFFAMKAEKIKQVEERAKGKYERRTLTDAIKQWDYYNPHAYTNVTRLLIKAATGQSVHQIRRQRNVTTALDALTAKEQRRYNALQLVAIGMLDMCQSYEEIKTALSAMGG